MKEPRLCLDIISSLPQNIIETILCLVPIRDAVRTSILSRNWRYNWVKIPKLVFNYKEMFNKSNQPPVLEQPFEEQPNERKHLTKRCKVFYAIYQVLLLHEGPIHEFSLTMNANNTCVEINQIICHLSRHNTLKKLTLDMKYILQYTVPESIFSLHHLTHLDLRECDLAYERIFNVSGSLISLYLDDVSIDSMTLLHLLSKSPLLKSLTILSSIYDTDSQGLISPQFLFIKRDHTITKLFRSLPMVECLVASIWVITYFTKYGVPRELATSLVHLKCLYLEDMCFVSKYGLPCLALMIRSSPNLEKLKIHMAPGFAKQYLQSEIDSVTLEDYSDIWLEHLEEFEIEDFVNLKPEMEFVKVILAKAPVLKKVKIVLYNKVDKDEELDLLRILLCSARASLVAKIFVKRPL